MGIDDKRPNTAGLASTKKCAHYSGGGGNRPGSADMSLGSTTLPSKLPTHMKIADILNRNGRKTSSSADLIKDFEHAIRKVVDTKRNESDKLKFVVEKKRDEVSKLKMALKDIKTDCDALGMNEFPDATDRLQPIASVSRRPIYAKKTNIRDIEDQLRKKNIETAAIVRRSLTYEHIKKRLLNEKMELIQAKTTLSDELREKQHRLQELNRVEIAANESYSQVQTRLSQLKADIAAEIQLYETELGLRMRWAKEKAKFEDFYAQQVAAVPSMVNSCIRPGSPSEKHRKVERDKTLTHWSQNLSPTELEALRNEEALHEEGFRRLGLPGGVINPNEIVDLCATHTSLTKELAMRQADQVQLLTSTRARIDEVKAELQQSQVSTTRTSGRDLFETQAQLTEAEKTLSKAREEYEYFHQLMQPVKAGIQQIVGQVLGTTVDVDSVRAIEDALHKVENELITVIPDLMQTNDDNNGTDIDSKLHAPSIAVLNPAEITSPFNIRIKPKDHSKTSHQTILDSRSVMHRRHKQDAGNSGNTEEHVKVVEVMDRITVKQLASNLAGQFHGKKKKNDA